MGHPVQLQLRLGDLEQRDRVDRRDGPRVLRLLAAEVEHVLAGVVGRERADAELLDERDHAPLRRADERRAEIRHVTCAGSQRATQTATPDALARLHDDDRPPAAAQLPRGGEPREPRADHDDVGPATAPAPSLPASRGRCRVGHRHRGRAGGCAADQLTPGEPGGLGLLAHPPEYRSGGEGALQDRLRIRAGGERPEDTAAGAAEPRCTERVRDGGGRVAHQQRPL